MAEPIKHHLASGIHPGAFVQPTEPNTSDVQDGVLWIDTSTGPPHVLWRWHAGETAWHAIQMDVTGYPIPGGHRLERHASAPLPPAYETAVLADAPLAFWPLTETEGSVAHDQAPDGFDATYPVSSAVTLAVAGPGEGCLKCAQFQPDVGLAANEGVISLSSPVGWPDQPPAFSVEAWCQVQVPPWYSSGHRGALYLMSWAEPEWRLFVYYHPINEIALAWGDALGGTGVSVLATKPSLVSAPALGAWFHLAVCVDSADTANCTVYVDGVSWPVTIVGSFDLVDTASGPILIGGGPAATGAPDRWSAGLAELAFYEQCLEAGQVSTHYAASVCPPSAEGVSVLVSDVEKLHLPFPTLPTPPEQILGKDPTDGLPKWADIVFLARKAELPMDTGGQGQLPAPDSALPDDPPAPTTLQTDKLLPPVALPDPIIDNCPIMRCGAAYYLAQKLKEQYDIVRNCLLGMLAAPFLVRVPAATAPLGIPIIDLVIARLSDGLIEQMGADILWLTRLMTKLSRWLKVAGVSFSVNRNFEDLGEDGNTKLQRLAYPCLTCSENIFNLSQDMLIAWELAINADTAEFTDWQRHLLVYILQCTPFGIYHSVAAQGAAITSDTCGGF